jgi:hypothetical protein
VGAIWVCRLSAPIARGEQFTSCFQQGRMMQEPNFGYHSQGQQKEDAVILQEMLLLPSPFMYNNDRSPTLVPSGGTTSSTDYGAQYTWLWVRDALKIYPMTS